MLALGEWLWRRSSAGPDFPTFVAGVAMLAGLFLRTWAGRSLGQHLTWNAEVQGGQTVIGAGPCRRSRHPRYTGALLLFGATPLAFHAWLVALPAWLALVLAFRRRIQSEEEHLRQEIPGYADCVTRTGALWPRLGARPAR
ncbi:MAG: isoprenylcysteine carboxylmethyltransferase family protein [Candidatus Sericytochromatia bacterium]|nr:isoprenylcysteine carboxylmethyltransferase family protein [Candidatus Tanganyikabacteria bacterium]